MNKVKSGDHNDSIEIDAFQFIACPVCQSVLTSSADKVFCTNGHQFPVVHGVAVLLRDDVEQTIGIASQSLEFANSWVNGRREDSLFTETLGLSESERLALRDVAVHTDASVDPVVSYLIGATNGLLYKNLIGNLNSTPIPDMRLPTGGGRTLVDIGCSWGRWSLAAAEKGWHPIGIDPSLGAVLAARRLAKARGLPFSGVVGDARYLPLNSEVVDAAFSYSVLQHFSKHDAKLALRQLARVVRTDGNIRIQMASAMGVRSLQHIIQRRFATPTGFDVRYWMPSELQSECQTVFQDGDLEVDCFFGLGLQASDYQHYGFVGRRLVNVSEWLRALSIWIKPLRYLADSVYLVARNRSSNKLK